MMMSLNSFFRFFSLETLDTRLNPPPNEVKKRTIIAKSTKSRWGTLEFKLYYLVFLIVVPLMFKTAMSASNETNSNYDSFQDLLSPGWMFGRKVDNSDQQFRFFRDNFFLLVGLIGLHSGLRYGANYLSIPRISFDFGFGLVFLVGAHGTNVWRIFVHLLVNYLIGKYVSSVNAKVAVILSWIYGVSTLFLNDRYRDYPIGDLIPVLSFLDTGFKGIITRWDVFFNFTLMRMLSFNFDYMQRRRELSEANTPPLGEDSSIKGEKGKILLNDRERLNAPLLLSQYNVFNYFAYITYAPLYIAGPVITFNDFIYQSQHRLPSINTKGIVIYGLRLVFCLFVMESLLHSMYVVAVSKRKAWSGDTPFEISMIGLFNLNIIWLKLLIPWRTFRLWSLIDGIDPPENMIRCMDNNYSAMAFWRAWHRSFNKWVVRYIYIPLGGSKSRTLTSLAVFSFVAVWHDIELRLLLWGWLIVLFLLPEIFITQYFTKFIDKWWYRHAAAMGGVCNIWMMMIANLYGFCLGHDGTVSLLKNMFSTFSGLEFFLIASGSLFTAVQIMFELRQSELRRGVDVRC